MTNKETKTIDEVLNIIKDLRNEINSFYSKNKQEVEVLSKKVEIKQIPISLEQDILRSAQEGISASIKTTLTAYNSPLAKLIENVINNHAEELKDIITKSFELVIRKEEFKLSIISAFSHKVSRSIISNNTGLFDKVSNELKNDATFKSKITLAVANVVEECLKEKNR